QYIDKRRPREYIALRLRRGELTWSSGRPPVLLSNGFFRFEISQPEVSATHAKRSCVYYNVAAGPSSETAKTLAPRSFRARERQIRMSAAIGKQTPAADVSP